MSSTNEPAPARPSLWCCSPSTEGKQWWAQVLLSAGGWRNCKEMWGHAFCCLNFIAMLSTGTSSGFSRNGMFFVLGFDSYFIVFGSVIFDLLFFIVSLGFFSKLKRKLPLYTCNSDTQRAVLLCQGLAFLAGCSSSRSYCTLLQVMHGWETCGCPWSDEIVPQWLSGLSWGKFRLSHSEK